MLTKVISGGQTGADQAGLRAAKACGLQTGGMVPRGCLTEEGPCPDLVNVYGCHESTSDKYPPRTFDNVKNSNGTVRLAYDFDSPGEKLTLKAIISYDRPFADVRMDRTDLMTPEVVANWIVSTKIATLNVAGNREGTRPGIGVEAFLTEVFQLCKAKEATDGSQDFGRQQDRQGDQAGDRGRDQVHADQAVSGGGPGGG